MLLWVIIVAFADVSGANERFSGRGHRNHVCQDCQQMPREKRQRIEQLDELYGFLDQSNTPTGT